MDFAERLRDLRLEAGLTQHELADGIVADSYVSLIEGGRRTPSPALVAKFAERLGVAIEELSDTALERDVSWNLNLARVALAQGEPDQARHFADLALASTTDEQELGLRARVARLQATARIKGAQLEAIEECEMLLVKFPKAPSEMRSTLAVELVRLHYQLGNLHQGAERGEAMIRESLLGDWPPVALIDLYCSVATCQLHRGDSSRAAHLASSALNLAEATQSPQAIVHAHWESAVMSQAAGDVTGAVWSIREAVRWCEAGELVAALPQVRNVLAALLVELPDPDLDDAEALAETALLEMLAQQNAVGASFAELTLALVELKRHRARGALFHADRGLMHLGDHLQGPKIELMIARARARHLEGAPIEELWSTAEQASQLSGHGQSREVEGFWIEIARLEASAGNYEAAAAAYERMIGRRGTIDGATSPESRSRGRHD